ncbi:MAG: CRISPR-associated endonuclease Cas2 [Thermoprotei archaeon]|nr:MAG: CRISPR-associated endonuclease Cas2 [Thermoprotei archaeon]
MIYLIVYDITKDKIRNEVSKRIKNWGGERIQYSAFKIELDERKLESLLNELKNILGCERGRIVAIPVCKKDLENIITLYNNYKLKTEDIIL